MTTRTCKSCNRPLMKEEGDYCPHCTAKRVGKVGKVGKIVGMIGTATGVVVGAIVVLGKILKK